MKEGFIANLKMLESAHGLDAQALKRRQDQVVSDLLQLVPQLMELRVSEPQVTLMPVASSLWLHLTLVPRRQALLFDAAANPKEASLRHEVLLVRKAISKAPLQARIAANDLVEWATGPRQTRLDPVHELAFRRARQQWLMENETGQLCLAFPDAPRYLTDERSCRIRGMVEVVSTTFFGLRHVEIYFENAELPEVPAGGRLRVLQTRRADDSVPTSSAAEPETLLARCVEMDVTVHRCLLTKRPIGAVASKLRQAASWASGEASARQQR